VPIDWGNASDDDIIRAYRERFGGDVSAITGYTEDGTERLEASYQQSIDWYNQFRQRTGRAPTKEEWAQEISFETGMGYDTEVEMIRLARGLDLVTTPYAFNTDEARRMAEAGWRVGVGPMAAVALDGVPVAGAVFAPGLSREDRMVLRAVLRPRRAAAEA